MRTIKVTPDFYDNTREQYDAKLAARTINEKALYFVLEPNGHRTLYKGTQIVGAKLDELNETIDKLNAILQDAPEEYDTLVELATVLTQLKADLQANKLNKIWTDITEQTTTNLTDILVFNRGSNVYKTTIANLLQHITVVELFTVVTELPEAGLSNKIYLVPSSNPETQNTLDEFIWVDNAWEKIGAVSVDLSNYDTKSEVDGKITAHNTSSEAHQDIRDDIETAEQNANEYTDEEVAKKVDLIANQNIGGIKDFTDVLHYKGRQVLTTETGNIYSQQIADLQANKLNKIWTDITEQTTTNLTDILVFNRGSNVYKTTVGNLLSQVDTQLYLVVAELPTNGNPNKIYLVPSSEPETQNTLEEFIWVNNDWEKIGAVSVDLSDYFNKTEINSMLDNKVDKNANITAGTHPKITYDEKGLVIGGEALAASDIPNLAASKISAGTFDEARIPSLSPTKITQNASNRFVTDTEKSTWNSKVDEAQLDLKADITYVDDMIGDIESALDAILGV